MTLNRRRFLGLVGGTAAAVAVNRVYSFPTGSIKLANLALPKDVFVEKYIKSTQGDMLFRWDVLYGFGALYPDNCAYLVKNVDAASSTITIASTPAIRLRQGR